VLLMSVTTTFVPNPVGIARLFSPTGDVGLWMQMKVEQVETLARENCPKDTGALAASIEGRVLARPTMDVSAGGATRGMVAVGQVSAGGNAAPYAVAVHEGTRPHPITPKNARVLAFPSRSTGAMVFTTYVNHPGTRAQPFLFDALRSAIVA